MTPPGSSKVEELVVRLHDAHCTYLHRDGQRCPIRFAVIAALDLAAETVAGTGSALIDEREWRRHLAAEVRSLIPSEKPREEP